MENIKNLGLRILQEKRELEERINRGIKYFNSKNNENIPLINGYDYYIKNLNYSFEENGILFSWEKELSSCGGYTDYEDKEQIIPYDYFNISEEDELSEYIDVDKDSEIQKDILRRANAKKEIEGLKNDNIKLRKDSQEHQKNINSAKKIEKEYGTYINTKLIEQEMRKCEAMLFLNEEKIKELEEDLK